jgi:hypothetical protein
MLKRPCPSNIAWLLKSGRMVEIHRELTARFSPGKIDLFAVIASRACF